MQVDLLYTTLVTTAFEVGGEEGSYNLQCLGYAEVFARHGKDVGIVVLTCQNGQGSIPAECSTDTVVLVANHGDTITGRADSYSVVAFAFRYGLSHLVTEVRVVAAFLAVASVVNYFGTAILQEELYLLLQSEASVIRSQADSHLRKWFHRYIVYVLNR